MTDVISPARIAAGLTEHWSPRVVAAVGDSYVKVAKVQGSLTWHSHDDECICCPSSESRRCIPAT